VDLGFVSDFDIRISDFRELMMRVCSKCRTEHEDGTELCRKCQSPLTTKEEAALDQGGLPPFYEEKAQAEQESSESLLSDLSEEPAEIEEPPKKRLICPRCKLIYEGRETCIRCGSTLTDQTPSQEEKPQPADAAEAREKTALPETPVPEEEILPFRLEDVPPASLPKPPPPSGHADEAEEVLKQSPTQRASESKVDRKIILPRKKNFNFRRLPLEAFSVLILVIAGGYLLWSLYSHFIMKRPGSSGTFSKGGTQAATASAPATTPFPDSSSTVNPVKALPAASQETEEIKGLLENIRKANLEKNIELFMSCYASDFKDREEKKRATLEAWKDFDYQNLSFDLKKQSISGQTAHAKVEWLVKISSKTGGPPEESKTLLDVMFKKEDTGWKIKEIKP